MEFIEIFTEYLPVFMFATLALLLFSGYPVAFLLGGLSIAYGLIGYSLGAIDAFEDIAKGTLRFDATDNKPKAGRR